MTLGAAGVGVVLGALENPQLHPTRTQLATRNRQRIILPAGPQKSAVIVPVEYNNFQAGFAASWELDVFGGIRRSVQAATPEMAATQEKRSEELIIFLGDVGRVYAQIRGFQRRLEIANNNIKTQQDALDLT